MVVGLVVAVEWASREKGTDEKKKPRTVTLGLNEGKR
jgi:hypothetical protein